MQPQYSQSVQEEFEGRLSPIEETVGRFRDGCTYEGIGRSLPISGNCEFLEACVEYTKLGYESGACKNSPAGTKANLKALTSEQRQRAKDLIPILTERIVSMECGKCSEVRFLQDRYNAFMNFISWPDEEMQEVKPVLKDPEFLQIIGLREGA